MSAPTTIAGAGSTPGDDRAARGHAAVAGPPAAPVARPRRRWWGRGVMAVAAVVAVGLAAVHLVPMVRTALKTVSTDDAYVNGHVTFVAPRVAGQVARVLVDDNMRVKQGQLLVGLDKEPYQVQVEPERPRLEVGPGRPRPGRGAGRAPWRGPRGAGAGSSRAPMEQVDNQVAVAAGAVAALESRRGDPRAGPGRLSAGPRS